ncbi:hypothetical protein ABT294_43125 [Nonomuraea sp. NPDC000554]|uniref:hypothetical protein n=1 Tax=Nonomuraea sp. NPDC000554 TaxID=3154259 RepID=UPI00331FC024
MTIVIVTVVELRMRHAAGHLAPVHVGVHRRHGHRRRLGDRVRALSPGDQVC